MTNESPKMFTIYMQKIGNDLIKSDLNSAGYVTNEEKSIWEPCQVIELLGLCWTKDATVQDWEKYILI